MSDILYMQLKQNIIVHHPHVHLQDIASLNCSNAHLLNRLRVLPILTFDCRTPNQQAMSVMDLIMLIHKKESDITISSLGESDFIITYEKLPTTNSIWNWCKTALICIITFCGSSFSIMTFNNDVDTSKLFKQIYFQLTHTVSNGFTILEISYSVGIGLGVLLFFNHFSQRKTKKEPSPMQVQMNSYENDVNKTIIEKNMP